MYKPGKNAIPGPFISCFTPQMVDFIANVTTKLFTAHGQTTFTGNYIKNVTYLRAFRSVVVVIATRHCKKSCFRQLSNSCFRTGAPQRLLTSPSEMDGSIFNDFFFLFFLLLGMVFLYIVFSKIIPPVCKVFATKYNCILFSNMHIGLSKILC